MFNFKPLFWIVFILSALQVEGQEIDSTQKQLQQLLEAYRYDQVIELLESNPKLEKKNLTLLADAQLKSGRLLQALSTYQQLYAADSNLNDLLQQARIYDKINESSKAMDLFHELTEREKDNAYYWKLFARSANKNSDIYKAIAAYYAALKLQPSDLEAIDEQAHLLGKVEQYEMADSLLKAGLFIAPGAQFLKRSRLNVLYRQRKYDEVVQLSEQLFEAGDSNLVAQKIAGISNYHVKEYERSIVLLNKVIQYESKSDLLYYFLGLNYREMGNPQKASEYLEKSIELGVSDNLPNYYTQLAVSYEEAGYTAKAIQAYKIAYNETKDKVLLYHLARNYDLYYKDKQVALNYYEKYLEEKDTANEYLMNYSKHRIQELKASVHFDKETF